MGTLTAPAPPRRVEPAAPAVPGAERPSGRPRSAAAQRAYARRAQRQGDGPTRAERAAQVDNAGRAGFVVLVIVLLVVGVATTLWLSTQAISDSYRLDEAKKRADDLAERAAVLQREVASQDTPGALAQKAKDLGMVFAGDPARLVVQPDGSVVVVGEPKPAQAPAPPVTAAPPASPTTQTPDPQQNQAQMQNQQNQAQPPAAGAAG